MAVEETLVVYVVVMYEELVVHVIVFDERMDEGIVVCNCCEQGNSCVRSGSE